MVDWVTFRQLTLESITIPLILLVGWYMMKDYDEGKKKTVIFNISLTKLKTRPYSSESEKHLIFFFGYQRLTEMFY